MDEKTEVQVSEVTCPGSQSWDVADLGFKVRWSGFREHRPSYFTLLCLCPIPHMIPSPQMLHPLLPFILALVPATYLYVIYIS